MGPSCIGISSACATTLPWRSSSAAAQSLASRTTGEYAERTSLAPISRAAAMSAWLMTAWVMGNVGPAACRPPVRSTSRSVRVWLMVRPRSGVDGRAAQCLLREHQIVVPVSLRLPSGRDVDRRGDVVDQSGAGQGFADWKRAAREEPARDRSAALENARQTVRHQCLVRRGEGRHGSRRRGGAQAERHDLRAIVAALAELEHLMMRVAEAAEERRGGEAGEILGIDRHGHLEGL